MYKLKYDNSKSPCYKVCKALLTEVYQITSKFFTYLSEFITK